MIKGKTKRKIRETTPSFILTVERIIYATSTSLYDFLLVHTSKLHVIDERIARSSETVCRRRGEAFGQKSEHRAHPGGPRRAGFRLGRYRLYRNPPFRDIAKLNERNMPLRGETRRISAFRRETRFTYFRGRILCRFARASLRRNVYSTNDESVWRRNAHRKRIQKNNRSRGRCGKRGIYSKMCSRT